MSQFFLKSVNHRSHSAMIEFLKGHSRYYARNGFSSYANNISIKNLGLSPKQADKAVDTLKVYDRMNIDIWEECSAPLIKEFSHNQKYRYTIGTNDCFNDHLILYRSRLECSGHLSYCPCCGQRNYKKVPPAYQDSNEALIAEEILNGKRFWQPNAYLRLPTIQSLPLSVEKKLSLITKLKTELRDCSVSYTCSLCGNPRCNYAVQPSQLVIESKGVHQGEAFRTEDWSMARLHDRIELICAFDAACDAIRSKFIALLNEYQLVKSVKPRFKLLAQAA